MNIIYIAKKEDENNLLKNILKNKLYISNKLLNKLKSTKSILVNNVKKNVTYKLNENDKITIDLENMNKVIYTDKNNVHYKEKKYLDKYTKSNDTLDILYEDEFLLIVNKPYGMPIHPSCSNYKTTLSNCVATYLESQNIYSIHIVTRLDKNTSGICIFAKNEYVQELFIRKKDRINVKKEYIAIVYGMVEKDHDIIEKKIARKPDSIILRQIDDNGDYAKTEFYVISRNIEKNYSILNVILHTGRTHQIRVHMSYIGHVLLGDTLYANESNKDLEISKFINRQALHANKITFYHPITNELITLNAKIPDDMNKLL